MTEEGGIRYWRRWCSSHPRLPQEIRIPVRSSSISMSGRALDQGIWLHRRVLAPRLNQAGMRFLRGPRGRTDVLAVVVFLVFTGLLAAFQSYGGSWQRSAIESEQREEDGFAYVFYATEDNYACSALVNIYRLQDILHVQHRIVVLVSPLLSGIYVDAFHGRNVTVIPHEPPPLADGSIEYYRDVLLKLVSFRLHHVVPSLKRILVLDSDQLILQNLDSLFQLPHVNLAAPRAYWISKDSICSAFMLVELSDRLADRMESGLMGIHPDEYDMDLVNRLLGEEVMMLPGHYVTLNSHWEAWDLPKWYTGRSASEPVEMTADGQQETEGGDVQKGPNVTDPDVGLDPGVAKDIEERKELAKDLTALYAQAEVLHFTALGKPWTYSEELVAQLRPDAHPLFREQFATWGSTAQLVCPNWVAANYTVPAVNVAEIEAPTAEQPPVKSDMQSLPNTEAAPLTIPPFDTEEHSKVDAPSSALSSAGSEQGLPQPDASPPAAADADVGETAAPPPLNDSTAAAP